MAKKNIVFDTYQPTKPVLAPDGPEIPVYRINGPKNSEMIRFNVDTNRFEWSDGHMDGWDEMAYGWFDYHVHGNDVITHIVACAELRERTLALHAASPKKRPKKKA